MRKAASVLTVGAVALTGITVTSPAAHAKTIKACVKKSDGSVKFINKRNKKCKKGWKLRTWNSKGPQGEPGPAGPAWTVKDKNGVTLGTFAGYSNIGLLPTVIVELADGGLVAYDADGSLNTSTNIHFLNNGCTDAVFRRDTNNALQPFLKSAGGSGRLVFQVANTPTASAWGIAATTITSVPIGANMLFQKDPNTGVCSAATHPGGFYLPLAPATAPTVAAPGPLQILK